jgi:Dot/Icm secretion system protein IcmQ
MTYVDFVEKLKKMVTTVLSVGDWGNSIFLKASSTKLTKLYDEAQNLLTTGEKIVSKRCIDTPIDKRSVPKGYVQIFILLYQVDGSNLASWYRNVAMLTEYGVARPAYKEEVFIRELIRSKSSDIERSGYVVVNVKESDFYNADQVSLDMLGHQLFTLKEKTIKLENIVEFVHANKEHYIIEDDKLIQI